MAGKYSHRGRPSASLAHDETGDPPPSDRDFLLQLGAAIRGARANLRISRQELARRSGVSSRYIAQIETGKGNVSVVLLLRILRAFRCNAAAGFDQDRQDSRIER